MSLRVAVIGASARGFGARAHIPAVKAAPGLELVAVCTAHDDTARAAAELHGVPRWFGDPAQLFVDDEIDLVTVAVRPAFHRELAIGALEANKMVYCEWPLALNTAEASAMAAVAAGAQTTSAVGLQGRYAPAVRTMRRLVEEGQIGVPLTVDASLLQPKFPVHSDRGWLSRRSEASGALFVASAHLIDTVQHVTGPLRSITAVDGTLSPGGSYADTGDAFEWDTSDTVAVLGEFTAGAVATIRVSNITDPGLGFSLRIAGEEGQLLATSPAYLQFSPITLMQGRPGGAFQEVAVDTKDDPVDLADTDPAANVARAMSAFGDAVGSGARFRPDFADAVELHRLLDAVSTASSEREWVQLDRG